MHPDNLNVKPTNRKIRSFVLRTGRMTPSQERAYNKQWPIFGLDCNQGKQDLAQLFNNNNDVILEIGFGMGDSLFQMAKDNPNQNFIGIEVHTPGVGRLLNLIAESQLKNIRIYEHDAVEIIEQCIPDNCLSRIQIFFPDPWHKAKHKKRRIIQEGFVETLRQKLKNKGVLHLATDWEDYALHMMSVLSNNQKLSNTCGPSSFSMRPEYRPITKFERRGERLGHGVWDLLFSKD